MLNVHSLFVRYAEEIDRFLRRRGHSADVAADITQDTFLRVMTSRAKTQPDNPRAYIHQIARNLSLDLHRRERNTSLVDVPDEALHAIADPVPGPEQTLIDRQRLAIVERAIADLPERTRLAFELYQREDRTISDVAGEIGLSVSRTWTLIRRAYGELRRALDDEAR